MADVNITQYSSYRFEGVKGVRHCDGSVRIVAGSMSLVLSPEEWSRIQTDIDKGTTLEDFRWEPSTYRTGR